MANHFDMDIAVIGAGMGGLGCALSLAKKGFKEITVYESAPNLGFVGAGIQMAPNMARILDKLGCWKDIYPSATNVQEASIRQGNTGQELVHVIMPDIEEKYGYPHCTGHRADLAGGMYEACQREPAITFKLGHPVASIDSFTPKPTFTVKPRSNTSNTPPYQVQVDLLLAADGIKSTARTALLAHTGTLFNEADTGQASYRIMLQRADLAHDPELLSLLDSDCVVRWIGEKRHLIAYPIANHSIYNIATTQPDVNFAKGASATYTTITTTTDSKPEMLRVFADFCPVIQRMLRLVPEGDVVEWKLRQHMPLATWSEGCVALLGDACHPTLPHLSQGAAMAIEDGAVLAELLSQIPPPPKDVTDKQLQAQWQQQNVLRALKAYELLRKDRTTTLVELAAFAGRQLHLGEGKAREERDREFKEHAKRKGTGSNGGGGSGGKIADKWASPDVQKMIYEHDCVREAVERFDEVFWAN